MTVDPYVVGRIDKDELGLLAAEEEGVGVLVEGVAAANAGFTRVFNEGLASITVAAGQLSAEGFGSLSDPAKDELLRTIETDHPAFFDQLVLQTYNGYYTNTEVFDAIGYKLPSPPTPGATPELLDESLLDEQRKREPFWKKV